MNQEKVKSLLEKAFQQSKKTPSLWHLPKILQIKQQLEQCQSIPAVINLLEQHRSFIEESLALPDNIFDHTLTAIRSLDDMS